MIERKDIEQRIGELQFQEQQHLAHANACSGAVAELSRLLAAWEAPAESGERPPLKVAAGESFRQ